MSEQEATAPVNGPLWKKFLRQDADGQPLPRGSVSASEILAAVNNDVTVYVEYAIIEGPVAKFYGTVVGEFALIDCEIRESLRFNYVTFQQSLVLTQSIVADIDLTSCTVVQDFVASAIRCQSANFRSISVQGDWIINDNAVFEGSANFENVSVGRQAHFSRSTFNESPNFVLSSFHGFADFTGTEFAKGVVFTGAQFESFLVFNEVKASGVIDFSDTSIQHALRLNDCIFGDTVNLSSATIRGNLELSAQFAPGAVLQMRFCRVESLARLKQCTFGGKLDATNAAFSGGLEITGVTFKEKATFKNVRALEMDLGEGKIDTVVPGDFTEYVHEAEVDFSGVQVDNSFSCIRILFKKGANFSGMTVGRAMFIYGCRFAGKDDSTQFNRSEFQGQFGCGSLFENATRFSGTIFRRAVRFHEICCFEGRVEFYFAHFADEANFELATLNDEVDFRYARFERGLFFKPWNADKGTKFGPRAAIDLRGCSYEDLLLPNMDKPATIDAFLGRFHSGGPFDRTPYLVFEQMLRRMGKRELADRVRREWHRRERKSFQWQWDDAALKALREIGAWLMNTLQGIATGYGTRISFLAAILVLLIMLAALSSQIWPAEPTRRVATAIITAMLALGTPLFLDAARRRVWPQ